MTRYPELPIPPACHGVKGLSRRQAGTACHACPGNLAPCDAVADGPLGRFCNTDVLCALPWMRTGSVSQVR
jgi:hypothetical protein